MFEFYFKIANESYQIRTIDDKYKPSKLLHFLVTLEFVSSEHLTYDSRNAHSKNPIIHLCIHSFECIIWWYSKIL